MITVLFTLYGNRVLIKFSTSAILRTESTTVNKLLLTLRAGRCGNSTRWKKNTLGSE